MIQNKEERLLVQRVIGSCIILWLVLLGTSSVNAQQQSHFSDFRLAPSQLNPGLTGAFKGTYRINGLYRGQWGNFGDSRGLRTIVGSAEFNVKGGLLLENDWIAGGISFYQDEAGTARRKYTATGFNIGYHIGLDKDYSNVFSVGLGYGTLGSSVSSFILRGQLDGTTQPNFSSGQFDGECDLPGCDTRDGNQPRSSDISLGFTYKTEINDNPLRLGISLLHLNEPETTIAVGQGGMIDSTMMMPVGGQRMEDPFRRVFALHAETSRLISPKVRINPAVLLLASGGTTEFQIQSTVDYLVSTKDQFSVTGGIGFRPLPSFDAGYLMAGVIIKDLTVRLSYDITLSSLNTIGGGNGFELAVGYIGRIYRDPNVDKVIFCPRL